MKSKPSPSPTPTATPTLTPMAMPKIGKVSPENAIRALRIGDRTPGGPGSPGCPGGRAKETLMPKLSLQVVNSEKNKFAPSKSGEVDKDKSCNNSSKSSLNIASRRTTITNGQPTLGYQDGQNGGKRSSGAGRIHAMTT